MTDEPEAQLDDAQVRAARFGALPARVHPDDAIAMTETDVPRVKPDDLASEEQWLLRAAAG
jgi:hypothetical protein